MRIGLVWSQDLCVRTPWTMVMETGTEGDCATATLALAPSLTTGPCGRGHLALGPSH